MDEITVIQRKIYEIRGQKVILDRDLAALYQVETKVLNQAVKRNIERFPEDFMFQLTHQEWMKVSVNEDVTDLKSQIVTSNWGGVRKLPYAFTEHGVVMMASLLRSEIAVKMSVQITRAFVAMRQALVALTATEAKVELLNEKIERLNLYIEEVMHDQNDMNEMQRAINEETAMQLELINQSLAELQAKPKQKPMNPVGFNSPIYKEDK
ncbi:MAG: ORF6N domain-containing protein [Paludibacteraceae bacterium]|nr:ORF6N domain-containing protein [Paludibacteraceae bacterium]